MEWKKVQTIEGSTIVYQGCLLVAIDSSPKPSSLEESQTALYIDCTKNFYTKNNFIIIAISTILTSSITFAVATKFCSDY